MHKRSDERTTNSLLTRSSLQDVLGSYHALAMARPGEESGQQDGALPTPDSLIRQTKNPKIRSQTHPGQSQALIKEWPSLPGSQKPLCMKQDTNIQLDTIQILFRRFQNIKALA